MFKKAIGIAGLLFAFLGYSYAQVIPQYGIKAQLDIDLNEIKVVEKKLNKLYTERKIIDISETKSYNFRTSDEKIT